MCRHRRPLPGSGQAYGATGPVARGSGVDYDLRRDDPYGYYDELDWNVVTEQGGDNFSRVLVRLREVEESARIIEQCVDLLEQWPEDDREIQANVPRTLRPDRQRDLPRRRGRKGRTRHLHPLGRDGQAGTLQDPESVLLEPPDAR